MLFGQTLTKILYSIKNRFSEVGPSRFLFWDAINFLKSSSCYKSFLLQFGITS